MRRTRRGSEQSTKGSAKKGHAHTKQSPPPPPAAPAPLSQCFITTSNCKPHGPALAGPECGESSRAEHVHKSQRSAHATKVKTSMCFCALVRTRTTLLAMNT